MRKLKLQMQMSVDGFAAGPNGEMDWMTWDWDSALKEYVTALTDTVDTMFVGREVYKGMEAHWPAAADNPESTEGDRQFAIKMNNLQKVVFSRTLDKVEWSNSRLAEGSIEEEAAALKQTGGEDIVIYGGASLVSSFVEKNLIDEYYLFINPVALGAGKAIFAGMGSRIKLKLTESKVFECGIVVNRYQPERSV
jgi:dihydrofolate reductase